MMSNQPNLTRSIKRLEKELGCTLFIRKKNGVELTPEGQQLYEHVSIAFEHIFNAEAELSKDESLRTGLVTISASEIALHCTLLPVLKKFHEQYPNVKIKVTNHTTPQALEILKNGLADLAVVTTPLGAVKSFDYQILRDIKEVAVCSADFTGHETSSISLEQLSQLPLISLGRESNSFSFYTEFFSQKGLSFEPDIEVATADQILPLVKSNLGIGFVPIDFLNDQNQIRILKLDEDIPHRQICLIKRHDANPSIATKTLEDMICHHSNN